jgi:hypothetical protein
VAYLLDMYSRCPISQAKYTPGTPLLDTCPYFDRDYLIRSRFGFSVGNWPWPDIEVVGGPRLRCFYSGFQGASRIRTNLPKAVRLAKRSGIGRSLRIDRLQLGSDVPPLLTKVPLVKGVNGHQYINNHKPKPVPLAPETGALLYQAANPLTVPPSYPRKRASRPTPRNSARPAWTPACAGVTKAVSGPAIWYYTSSISPTFTPVSSRPSQRGSTMTAPPSTRSTRAFCARNPRWASSTRGASAIAGRPS